MQMNLKASSNNPPKKQIGALKKLLLNYGIIFFCAITLPGNTMSANDDDSSPAQYRLPDTIIPLHYEIVLILDYIPKTGKLLHFIDKKTMMDETTRTFSGISEIHIAVKENQIQQLQFNIFPSQIVVTNCSLRGDSFPKIKYEPLQTKSENEIFTWSLNQTISAGHYILEILFEGIIPNDSRGVYKTFYTTKDGKIDWLLATHFLPIGARGLFPCWDEPKFNATFNIYIQYHRQYTVLSSVPYLSTLTVSENLKMNEYASKFSMSPHELAFVVLDFPAKYRRRLTSNITMWSRQSSVHAKIAQEIAEKVESLISEERNVNLNIEQIAIPGFSQDAMDYMGLFLYREAAIIYDAELDPPARKLDITSLVASTMLGQLRSDNRVSLSWSDLWSDLWLSDGIKSLYGIHMMEKILEPFARDLFLLKIRHESLHLDTYSYLLPLMAKVDSLSEFNALSPFLRYVKAPAILRMLEHLLTEKVFRNGLEQLFLKHTNRTATVAEFFIAMQTALDMSNKDNFNISLIMDPWIKNNHLPILETELRLDFLHIPCLLVKTSQTLTDYYIPVTYTTQKELDFRILKLPKWLTIPAEPFWGIPRNFSNEHDFHLVNLQQSGYYRVNYDITNWRRIANYLINGAYQKIHVLNRAQLIDDAFHLTMLNQLDVNMFVHLTTYLKREKNYLAWYPMFKALEYMSTFFLFPQSKDFKKHMGKIFQSVLDQIGYIEKPDHDVQTNFLREETAKWACVLGEIWCKAIATVKLKDHLGNRNKFSVWWKHWAYCHGISVMMTSKNMMLHFSKTLFGDDQIEEYITCLHPKHIPTYFTMIKSKRLRSIDPVKSYLLTVSKHANEKAVLRYILKKFNILKPKEISLIAAIIVIINHIYNEEQLIMIAAFLDVPLWEKKHEQDTCNKLFDQEVLFLEKVLQREQTFFMKITLPSRRKIEKRLSQIEHQKSQFVMFMKADSNIHA